MTDGRMNGWMGGRSARGGSIVCACISLSNNPHLAPCNKAATKSTICPPEAGTRSAQSASGGRVHLRGTVADFLVDTLDDAFISFRLISACLFIIMNGCELRMR